VGELLADPRTAFLLVTSPRRDAIDEAIAFRRRLRDSKMPFDAAIVNRVHELTGVDASAEDVEPDLIALLGDELGRKVARNFADYRGVAERDHANVERLRRELGAGPLLEVPLFDDDVHDIGGLAQVCDFLFAEDTVTA
jgi:anion-transporting  ArsA/GET3 family ATPase